MATADKAHNRRGHGGQSVPVVSGRLFVPQWLFDDVLAGQRRVAVHGQAAVRGWVARRGRAACQCNDGERGSTSVTA